MKFSLTAICTVAILAAAASTHPSVRSNNHAKKTRTYAKATAKSNANQKKTQAKRSVQHRTAKAKQAANVSLAQGTCDCPKWCCIYWDGDGHCYGCIWILGCGIICGNNG